MSYFTLRGLSKKMHLRRSATRWLASAINPRKLPRGIDCDFCAVVSFVAAIDRQRTVLSVLVGRHGAMNPAGRARCKMSSTVNDKSRSAAAGIDTRSSHSTFDSDFADLESAITPLPRCAWARACPARARRIAPVISDNAVVAAPMNWRAESAGNPLPLPCHARRHNWLKSWQKLIVLSESRNRPLSRWR